MVLRLFWRATHPAPPLPEMPAWRARLAHFTHVVLYAALFILPVAGYVGSVASGFPVKVFGVTLPAWGAKNIPLKDFCSAVHYVAGWVLAGAVTLHVAGALEHALVKRDRLLARMGVG
jgi:cytochrome b561